MIRKTFLTAITIIFALAIHAQNDTMYIMKDGFVINKQPIKSSHLDSIVFYKPLTTVQDVDGNTYKTLTLGTQVWMKENLKATKYNDGTSIPLVTDETEWTDLATPGFCWYNNDTTAKDWAGTGALYNWYSITYSKNVCPVGWHVPSRLEWVTLLDFLTANGYTYDGSTNATNGYKVAKAMSTIDFWYPLSTVPGAVAHNDFPLMQNASRFSAIAVGLRHNYGSSIGYSEYAQWWTDSQAGTDGTSFKISGDTSIVQETALPKQSGLSVRCVKN